MQKKIITFFCLTILLLVFNEINLFAASGGKIIGHVTDKVTGESLVGANVILTGTALGAATDVNGNYRIVQIPGGTYTLKVTYIGYEGKTEKVTIEYSETRELNFELNYSTLEGKTVTVTAQAEGQIAAINQQLSSDIISNVVSSEKILSLPDANAAEAVGRLPGISILRSGGEGNQVVIRGLSPAFNLITINGTRVSSTDLDNKGVDISMLSPEMLSGIEVKKSLTADMDAESIGGTVDFKLRGASKGFNLKTRMTGIYNNLRNDASNYKGFLMLGDRFWNDKFGIMVTGSAERIQRGADQYNADYETTREKRPGEVFAPIQVQNVNLRYTKDTRERKDFSIIMDYELSNSKIMLNSVISRLDRDANNYGNFFNLFDASHSRTYEQIISQTSIFTNSLSGEHHLDLGDFDWGLSSSRSFTRIPFDNSFTFMEKGGFDKTLLPQFFGPHELVNSAFNNLQNTYLYNGGFSQQSSIEEELTGKLNINIPYTISEQVSGYIKFGGSYRRTSRNRSSSDRFGGLRFVNNQSVVRVYNHGSDSSFIWASNGFPSILNYFDPNFNAGNFLSGEYNFGQALSGDELNQLLNAYALDSLYYQDPLSFLDDYEIIQNVSAGYIMAQINLGRYVMFLPGVRYEYTDANTTGRVGNVGSPDNEQSLLNQVVKDSTAINKYGDWFPMINLRIRPLTWFDVRLGYTKSLSRPRWNWMIPKKKINGTQYTVTIGRPDLKPQISTNYDLYLSFYGNAIGLFTAGAFYKEIQNLIFNRVGHKILNPEKEGFENNLGGFTLNRPENSPYLTKFKGFEIEWQANNFHWLPSPFDGIVLNINYTHIWSETQYPRSFVQQEKLDVFPYIKTVVIDTFRTGNMLNQPNDIMNFSIGYDRGHFSGRYSILFQGKTLRSVGERPEADGFTASLVRMDLSVKYNLSRQLAVFFSCNNMSNEPDVNYQQTSEYIVSEYYYGWTMNFGVGFTL